MTIGDRIKSLRESNKLTQTELAEKIGTTKQNIYKYENGIITNIPSDKVELMALVFGVSPVYIMGWDEDQNKKAPGNTAKSAEELLKTKRTKEKWDAILDELSQENKDRLQEQAELLLLKQQVQADKESK